MSKQELAVPPGWGDDELSLFLEQARRNQLATFHNKKPVYDLMREIDGCFLKPIVGMINPMELLSPFLLIRCHFAWRAACGTALAGQVVETNPHLRLALETAAYALFIHETPGADQTWMNRNDTPVTKKRMRDAFKLSAIKSAIEGRDRKLAEIFQYLYELSIDLGGHPNQLGVWGSAQVIETEERKQLNQIGLHGDGLALESVLKVLVETGICCLFLFQNIPTFTARFELLGIKERLNTLRQASGALVRKY